MDVKVDIRELMSLVMGNDELGFLRDDNKTLKNNLHLVREEIFALKQYPAQQILDERHDIAARFRDEFFPYMSFEAIANSCVRQYGANKIGAIKRYRIVTNIGLKESKEAIEAAMARMP